MWYTSAYVCMPATLCALIPVRVYLARFQYSVRLVPFTIGGRVIAGVFGQSVCMCVATLRFYISRSGSSCIRSRVLFAYFVLRTRQIRSSHFRHVCLCSSARDRIDGDVDAIRVPLPGTVSLWRITKKSPATRKHCFLLLLARARAYLRFRFCTKS